MKGMPISRISGNEGVDALFITKYEIGEVGASSEGLHSPLNNNTGGGIPPHGIERQDKGHGYLSLKGKMTLSVLLVSLGFHLGKNLAALIMTARTTNMMR
jgi:hypothetical protein